ncbi:MAG: putative lipid II flippase FtsW [Lachnospiraceae bacterium]|nr:putative lipid II flippase FtsW [Ruminococcus sp.]MCM1275939.1 putative lipid II flippase FtsW [Lachnospiraceae bacterium]
MQQARQNTAARRQPPRNGAPAGAPRGGAARPAPKQVRKPRAQKVTRAAVKPRRKKKEKDPNRVRLFSFQGRVDVPMMVIIMVLLVFGITMMFSAGHAMSYSDNGDSFYYVTRQMTAAAIGLVGMFVLSFLDYRFLRHEFRIFGKRVTATHLFLVFAMFLNLLTIPFGIAAEGGQKRWLPIPGFGQFQPSEVLKIAVIVYFAYYIHKHSDKMRKFYDGILMPGIMLVIILMSMISQMHLSCMVIICAVFAAMLFTGGSNLKYLLPICLLAIGLAVFVVMVLDVGYFKERIVYMDPLSEPGDRSYQNYQSALALGSGGIWGKGFGNSTQKYNYLPEAPNDFVFAVLVEEFGLIGGLTVIVLFLIFVFRGFYIARRAEDKFGCLLATGITFQIGLQAFLNLGVNLCCVPNTGISMPFFSYGGTALMLQLWEMGFLLSVSKRAKLK